MEIAVISGKGGTGKTSICAGLANLVNKLVVADCDVDAANLFILFRPKHTEEEAFIGGKVAVINNDICTRCRVCVNQCRFNAISIKNGQAQISDILCEGCGLCEKICPVNAVNIYNNDKSRVYTGNFRFGKMVYGLLAPGEENSGKLVNNVREKARKIAKENIFDLILIDGPPGISCPAISTITGVDHALIVTEATKSGMHDLIRTVEMVKKFDINFSVLINKYDINKEISHNIEKYCKESNIKISGKIKFDKEFVNAMVNRETIIEHSPNSEISIILRNTLKQILYFDNEK